MAFGPSGSAILHRQSAWCGQQCRRRGGRPRPGGRPYAFSGQRNECGQRDACMTISSSISFATPSRSRASIAFRSSSTSHPSFEPKTVAELIAYAKANPGKLSIATPPKGTGPSMAGELFKLTADIDVVFVRYRADAQVVTDLLGGQVLVAFGGISPVIPHIKAGKLRALGVTAAERSSELPNVPRIADTLTGFEASGWCGIVAPRNTPLEIVDKLTWRDQCRSRRSEYRGVAY